MTKVQIKARLRQGDRGGYRVGKPIGCTRVAVASQDTGHRDAAHPGLGPSPGPMTREWLYVDAMPEDETPDRGRTLHLDDHGTVGSQAHPSGPGLALKSGYLRPLMTPCADTGRASGPPTGPWASATPG
jgi:hypothetical protein